jgi:ArpU family phage transcriptional regulator
MTNIAKASQESRRGGQMNKQVRKKVEKMLRLYPDIDIRIANLEMQLQTLSISMTAHYGLETSGHRELNKVEAYVNQKTRIFQELDKLRRIKMSIDAVLPKLDARERKIFEWRYIFDRPDKVIWTSIPMSESGYFYVKGKLLKRFAYCLCVDDAA